MKLINIFSEIILLIIILVNLVNSQNQRGQTYQNYGRENIFTKEILIKQGRIRGIIRHMKSAYGLVDIDQFFGIPYAEPPIGSNRFMPPGSAPPWIKLFTANKMSPVCPQHIPDIAEAGRLYSHGRNEQLRRLIPFLKYESEDCLSLNLYVPSKGNLMQSPKFPVIVFVHGESFEWNSGNAYDGSMLASYGQVIVVTFNYRLGVFGFMGSPGPTDNTITNFGLFDQVAALQWVKENIYAFGGDHESVTLMGHSTGSVCINLLMVSPIATGLFHRAILMSGSALADWATAQTPWQVAAFVAQQLNCSEDVLDCLRKKKYQEILDARPKYPKFATMFGPIIDNHVIPKNFKYNMQESNNYFGRYDLLFGVTEIESYHNLNALALVHGLLEHERDSQLRFYIQNRFDVRPEMAFGETIKEYTQTYFNPNKAAADEHRDNLLEILSDARVVAPTLQTGIYHSKNNPRSYMYVFSHNTISGDYSQLTQSVVGEELPYVFGAPIDKTVPFLPSEMYTNDEKLLSEAIMRYWTNFAKTGNPKAPWIQRKSTINRKWEMFDIDWPEFSGDSQNFLNIGIPPVIGEKYRYRYMKFWNTDLPRKLNTTNSFRAKLNQDFYDYTEGRISEYPKEIYNRNASDAFSEIRSILSKAHGSKFDHHQYGGITSPPPTTTTEVIPTENDDKPFISMTQTSLYILIIAIILFFALNVILLTGYLLQKKYKLNQLNSKGHYEDEIYTGTPLNPNKILRSNDNDDNNTILNINKTSGTNDLYEPVKTTNGYKLTRQLSDSTIDPHRKVFDWITQDGQDDLKIKNNKNKQQQQSSSSKWTRKFCFDRPQKVNVGIDATSRGRSIGFLDQQPIVTPKEINKRNDDMRSTNESSPLYSNSIQSSNENHENITSFIEPHDIILKSDEVDSSNNFYNTNKLPQFHKNLPQDNQSDIDTQIKRRSLPSRSFLVNVQSGGSTKIPPTPPPRAVSTLGRNFQCQDFSSSPIMIAEEPPDTIEPEITLNTLYVGPIIPKIDGIYSYEKSRRSNEQLKLIKIPSSVNYSNSSNKIYDTICLNKSTSTDNIEAAGGDCDGEQNNSEKSSSSSESSIETIIKK